MPGLAIYWIRLDCIELAIIDFAKFEDTLAFFSFGVAV